MQVEASKSVKINLTVNWIRLAQVMDEISHYRESDVIIKLSLNTNEFATPEKQLGMGSFGRFYGGYNSEEKEKIKSKLGPVHQDVGFKRFRQPGEDFHQNLQEILAFIYIAPYISANTDLKTPTYRGELSLSGIISNNTLPTQKMPGIKSHRAYIMLDDAGINIPDFTRRLCDQIYSKLIDIGVFWTDLTTDNYLVDEETIKEYINSNQQINVDSYDFSKGVSLFDFGGFLVQKETNAGRKLLALQKQLNKIQNNAFAVDIDGAIDAVLT